jgi:hypothetical protein
MDKENAFSVTEQDNELLQRQNMLQQEARAVVEELGIVAMLSKVGTVRVLGSSVLGLMTWRDIDIAVSSPGLTSTQAYEAMQPLLTHPRVKHTRYNNESGSYNPTGLTHDERYFFMVYYDRQAESDWKIDISFWLAPGIHPEPIYEAVKQQLTPETRLAILRIKDVWYKLPFYRQEVSSVDIYDAVLQHDVRTLDEFDAYLNERSKPIRAGNQS